MQHRKVTFVEELPDMDELESMSRKRHIIENYEPPPPPPPSGKRHASYSLYENIYGGSSNTGSSSSSGSAGSTTSLPPLAKLTSPNDDDEAKELLQQKMMQRMPTRVDGGMMAMPPQNKTLISANTIEYQEKPVLYTSQHPPHSQHPEHTSSFVIYENPQVPHPYQNAIPPPPPHLPRQLPQYRPYGTPPNAYRRTSIVKQPRKILPKRDISLCSMVDQHIRECGLCNSLYISTLSKEMKSKKSYRMNKAMYIVTILVLIIVCIVLVKKLYSHFNLKL